MITKYLLIWFLGMEEDFLSDKHRFMMEGRDLNTTIFRTNFYPTLEGMSEDELADGVVRIGQHADYGSITLLVQDDIGGLEVLYNDNTPTNSIYLHHIQTLGYVQWRMGFS